MVGGNESLGMRGLVMVFYEDVDSLEVEIIKVIELMVRIIQVIVIIYEGVVVILEVIEMVSELIISAGIERKSHFRGMSDGNRDAGRVRNPTPLHPRLRQLRAVEGDEGRVNVRRRSGTKSGQLNW